MKSRLLIAFAALLLASCSGMALPTIESVGVVESVGVNDGWPSHITLAVEVNNPSSRIKLLSGRVRLSYGGRRVAMFTLEDKVVVPARCRSIVEVPLHLAVQRNAQTLAFREALREHRSESISIDWQVALRSRMTYISREQATRPIAELLSQEQQEALWQMLDKMMIE